MTQSAVGESVVSARGLEALAPLPARLSGVAGSVAGTAKVGDSAPLDRAETDGEGVGAVAMVGGGTGAAGIVGGEGGAAGSLIGRLSCG